MPIMLLAGWVQEAACLSQLVGSGSKMLRTYLSPLAAVPLTSRFTNYLNSKSILAHAPQRGRHSQLSPFYRWRNEDTENWSPHSPRCDYNEYVPACQPTLSPLPHQNRHWTLHLHLVKLANKHLCAFSNPDPHAWQQFPVNNSKTNSLYFKSLLETRLCHETYKNLTTIRLLAWWTPVPVMLTNTVSPFPCKSALVLRLRLVCT